LLAKFFSQLDIDEIGELAGSAVCAVSVTITVNGFKIWLLTLNPASAIFVTSTAVVKMIRTGM